MTPSCLIYRRWLAGAEPFSTRWAGRVWTHIKRCRSCRTVYNARIRGARLTTTRGRTSLEPTQEELEVWTNRVVACALIDETDPPERPRIRWTWATAGAAGFALFAGLFLWPTSESLVPRGTGADFAVRALCSTEDVTGRPLVRSLSDHPGPQDLAACAGEVYLAYLSHRPGTVYVFEETQQGRKTLSSGITLPAAKTLRRFFGPFTSGIAVRRLEILHCASPIDLDTADEAALRECEHLRRTIHFVGDGEPPEGRE